MAKRTVKSQYQAKDATLSIKRQLVSGDGDVSEIYYEVAPQAEANPSTSSQDVPSPPYTAAAPEKTDIARPIGAPVFMSGNSSKKEDLPITALEIIIGIIAQKLTKSSEEILVCSTIKS